MGISDPFIVEHCVYVTPYLLVMRHLAYMNMSHEDAHIYYIFTLDIQSVWITMCACVCVFEICCRI